MSHLTYEQQKKSVITGLIILAVITCIELALALIMKPILPMWLVGLLMILFSLGKAYYIVMKFMHLGDETRSLKISVLLPTVLLIWGIIAFLMDGEAWKNERITQDYSSRYEQLDVSPEVPQDIKKEH